MPHRRSHRSRKMHRDKTRKIMLGAGWMNIFDTSNWTLFGNKPSSSLQKPAAYPSMPAPAPAQVPAPAPAPAPVPAPAPSPITTTGGRRRRRRKTSTRRKR